MSTPFKMKGFSGFGNSPLKSDEYAFNKGAKFHKQEEDTYEGGRKVKKVTGGFGGTNKKGYHHSEVKDLTKGFAEYMRRMDFSPSDINYMYEEKGVEGPYDSDGDFKK